MFHRAKLGIHSSIPALLQAKQILFFFFFFINSLRRDNLELFQYLITRKRHFDGNEKSQARGLEPKAGEMACSGSAPLPVGSSEMSCVGLHHGGSWEVLSCHGVCSLCCHAKGMPSLGGCRSFSRILPSPAKVGSSQGWLFSLHRIIGLTFRPQLGTVPWIYLFLCRG